MVAGHLLGGASHDESASRVGEALQEGDPRLEKGRAKGGEGGEAGPQGAGPEQAPEEVGHLAAVDEGVGAHDFNPHAKGCPSVAGKDGGGGGGHGLDAAGAIACHGPGRNGGGNPGPHPDDPGQVHLVEGLPHAAGHHLVEATRIHPRPGNRLASHQGAQSSRVLAGKGPTRRGPRGADSPRQDQGGSGAIVGVGGHGCVPRLTLLT